MAKPIFTPALASLGLVALSAGLLQGGGLAASLVLWLAVNVLITASFRFVTLIGAVSYTHLRAHET